MEHTLNELESRELKDKMRAREAVIAKAQLEVKAADLELQLYISDLASIYGATRKEVEFKDLPDGLLAICIKEKETKKDE